LIVLACFGYALSLMASERELVHDAHFQQGFHLLQPEQGKRVAYGDVAGLSTAGAMWDLAQWSSRFPLRLEDCRCWHDRLICSNSAKCVVVEAPAGFAADLSLAVNASVEYGGHVRQAGSEPWVRLLVQQDFEDPPSLGALAAFQFHLEARLKRSILARTNNYSPSLHAAQFTIFLTVANRNPSAPGYKECFWFGIPIYDNRHRLVPDYEAQDFGQTKLFIYTPGSNHFAQTSLHDGEWVAFDADILPLVRQGLEHARARKFIAGSSDLADYRPLGIFIGWELPGVFDVELQMRNLSLKAKTL